MTDSELFMTLANTIVKLGLAVREPFVNGSSQVLRRGCSFLLDRVSHLVVVSLHFRRFNPWNIKENEIAKGFYTILILPDATSKASQFHVTKPALLASAFLLGLVLTSLVFFVYQYFALKGHLLELRRLRRDIGDKALFLKRVSQIEEELSRLRGFDQKLRAAAGLEGIREGTMRVGEVPGDGRTPLLKAMKSGSETLAEAMSHDLDRLDREVRTRAKSLQKLTRSLEERRSLLNSTPTIWPVKGWLTSDFGFRVSPFTGRREVHEGIDIAAPIGTTVVASADGIVTFSGSLTGHGNVVFIEHGHGLATFYAHNSKNVVVKGQRVKRGQVIASVGTTGLVTGPHLHYGVKLRGEWVDPLGYVVEGGLQAPGEGLITESPVVEDLRARGGFAKRGT